MSSALASNDLAAERAALPTPLSPAGRAEDQDDPQYATTRQIVRACMRCRKQKSKCDAFRPCSVCVKAGAECVSRLPNEKRPDSVAGAGVREVQASASLTEVRPAKIRRVASKHHQERNTVDARASASSPIQNSCVRPDQADGSDTAGTSVHAEDGGSNDETAVGSATEIINVKVSSMNTNLFTLIPGHLMENTTPSSEQPHDAYNTLTGTLTMPSLGSDRVNASTASPSAATIIDPQYRAVLPWSHSRATAASLITLLPPRPVTDYLIAVYFNTVHWFMVVVHEGHFLRHYRVMMDVHEREPAMLSNADDDFTFAVLVLTMVVLGGRYASMHPARARRCRDIYREYCSATADQQQEHIDFDIVQTTSRLFSVVRSNTTDNLACGTLATVQSMLLLGSLCLYHGEPNLAWAYSGASIRTAQALGVHKDRSELRWSSSYVRSMDPAERSQLRYRLFWAVHTSDRFLAMCYGLPLVMTDDDCHASAPGEDSVYPLPGCSSFLMVEEDRAEGPVTLLTYQTYKLHVYIILGEIISGLYRQSSGGRNPLLSKFEPATEPQPNFHASHSPKPDGLIETAQRLEAKLQNWYNALPAALRLSDDMSYPAYQELAADSVGGEADEVDDEIIVPAQDSLQSETVDSDAARRRRLRIRKGVYGLQALLLQLSYDNALILIHRAILSPSTAKVVSGVSRDVFRRSADSCWRAAQRISRIGRHHIFHQQQQAHAVSYVGIHLFTAGVVLSVFANSDPLGVRAVEAKQGLRRIIAMQRRLRKKVVVSGQGLALLENLAREVVRQEMNAILGEDDDAHSTYADGDRRITAVLSDRGAAALRREPSPGYPTPDGATHQILPSTTTGSNSQRTQYSDSLLMNGTVAPFDLSGRLLDGVSDTNDLMLETDMFNDSVLDIEKLLSSSMSIPAYEPGMSSDFAFASNGAQSTSGTWWFLSE
ncbi:hypothetical protein SBRCBS47491_003922 [Sporothrix bragantina]|uniref:Zn(2)-C6 fungal-type domain-containing protein n=1 Tax=Sporothrix bragantina TaxID=671064 RepID=A0ABP0BJM9_9PEZI